MKNKEYKLFIDLLNYTIVTVQTDDVIKYRNDVLKKKYPNIHYLNDTAEAMAFLPNEGDNVLYIIFPYKTTYDSLTEIFIHEIVHIADHIIDTFGFEGTEIRAYLVQFIYSKNKKFFKLK